MVEHAPTTQQDTRTKLKEVAESRGGGIDHDALVAHAEHLERVRGGAQEALDFATERARTIQAIQERGARMNASDWIALAVALLVGVRSSCETNRRAGPRRGSGRILPCRGAMRHTFR